MARFGEWVVWNTPMQSIVSVEFTGVFKGKARNFSRTQTYLSSFLHA